MSVRPVASGSCCRTLPTSRLGHSNSSTSTSSSASSASSSASPSSSTSSTKLPAIASSSCICARRCSSRSSSSRCRSASRSARSALSSASLRVLVASTLFSSRSCRGGGGGGSRCSAVGVSDRSSNPSGSSPPAIAAPIASSTAPASERPSGRSLAAYRRVPAPSSAPSLTSPPACLSSSSGDAVRLGAGTPPPTRISSSGRSSLLPSTAMKRTARAAAASLVSAARSSDGRRAPAPSARAHHLRFVQCASKSCTVATETTRGWLTRAAHLARSTPVRAASTGARAGFASALAKSRTVGPRFGGESLKRWIVVFPDGSAAAQSRRPTRMPLGSEPSAS
mmetsp:Transcript_328/g.1059  ORF Transcript_328/g.1059 Transcript_328/m.1059 type:complete len:338 (+) Transcript_328:284-1297(+)